jgi:hypothetical protein
VAKYNWRQRKVLNIKPGITGLAQISGRSDLNFDEEILWIHLYGALVALAGYNYFIKNSAGRLTQPAV